MSQFSFDDFDGSQTYNRSAKPIWALGLDDPAQEKRILQWLKGEFDYLTQENQDRLRQIEKNLAQYKGIQYESQEAQNRQRDIISDRSKSVKKIVANHLYDLTENRVNRLIKFKPAVSILPTNDEFSDKVSSKITQFLLDHIWYVHNYEGLITPEIARLASVMGESYLFIVWNPDLGDRHPDSKEGVKVPLLDSNDQPEKDEGGNPIMIEEAVNVGDVDYEVTLATEVRLQRKQRIQDVEYCFRKKVWNTEELKLLYPKKAGEIRPSEHAEFYDFEKMEMKKCEHETVVYEFYHKFTKPLSKGRYIVYTDQTILVNKELPYSHGELPFKRLTDLDYPGEVHGISFFQNVKALTGAYNNLTNMILRNQVIASHPKWMMPKGAAKLEALGNDITIVQYQGPVAPALVTAPSTPADVFMFRKDLKEEFQQLSGVFGVSRGEPPPGIKAGIALQFLNEQENERFNHLVLKFNEFIRGTAMMTLSVAGDYYDPSDKRMVRVIGKSNEWMTRFFDTSHLEKDYDIRIQNSSALPQSKAARTQYLMDLSERYPNLFSAEQVLDMLDLAQSDKFLSQATRAVRDAEAENESILYGEVKSHDPADYEDHMKHWQIHVGAMQDYSFKNTVPIETQSKLKDHVLAHEMLMMKTAERSPAYQQSLAAIPQFPLFWVSPNLQEEAQAQADVFSQGQQGMDPAQAGPQPPGAYQPPPDQPVSQELGSPGKELVQNPVGPSIQTQQEVEGNPPQEPPTQGP